MSSTSLETATLVRLIDDLSRPRRFGIGMGRLANRWPWVARLARAPMRAPLLATRVTRLHASLLRLSGGRLRRSWLFAAGQPVLSLTTTGRRSGMPRTTAVACFRFEGQLATAAMNLGGERDPAWALNLQADPHATVGLRGRSFEVVTRRVTGAERERAWAQWLELQPSAEAFRALAGREIPIFVLQPRPGGDGESGPTPQSAP
jgi:deazaflavin-dependent oxidoreductase (nitroreductase family)